MNNQYAYLSRIDIFFAYNQLNLNRFHINVCLIFFYKQFFIIIVFIMDFFLFFFLVLKV